MRLGKHEKAILKVLALYHLLKMDWIWMPDHSGLPCLADPKDIARYEAGDIVPVWMLNRDFSCGKTILSRSLRTLERKGLIHRRGADLAILEDDYSPKWEFYAKYVSLTHYGASLSDSARLQS
jgi:hypothetical protein